MLNSKCTSELRSAYWFSAYRLDEAQIYKSSYSSTRPHQSRSFKVYTPSPNPLSTDPYTRWNFSLQEQMLVAWQRSGHEEPPAEVTPSVVAAGTTGPRAVQLHPCLLAEHATKRCLRRQFSTCAGEMPAPARTEERHDDSCVFVCVVSVGFLSFFLRALSLPAPSASTWHQQLSAGIRKGHLRD